MRAYCFKSINFIFIQWQDDNTHTKEVLKQIEATAKINVTNENIQGGPKMAQFCTPSLHQN